MKIIYYSPHPNLNLSAPSGPGTHMREVIHALESHGHQVVRLIAGGEESASGSSIAYFNPWYKRVVKQVLPTVVWQTAKDWSLRRFDRKMKKRLLELIDREKPDVIYERAYYLMTGGVEAAQLLHIAHILELNAPYPEEKIYLEGRSLYIARAGQCEHQQVAFSDRVLVVSSALRDYLISKYPRSADKLRVVPNATNPELAVAVPSAIDGLRKQLGIEQGELVFGFVGSIFKYHGVDLLLTAFKMLREKRPDLKAKLLIVGDGLVLPELKAYALREGLGEVVRFTGNVPHQQVYTHIALMDVAIMASSNWYGSPVKVFEYGLMKKVIIAPDNGPLRDVMVHGEDGLLVQASEESLFRAMMHCLDHPGEMRVMAQHFHQKVVEQHTWLHTGQNIAYEMAHVLDERKCTTEDIPQVQGVLALRTDFAHHGKHSGYKQLLQYICPYAVLGLREGEEDLNPKLRNRYQWLFEFQLRKFMPRTRLIHIMYAEDYLRFSPYLYRHIPIVATFHQPASTLLREITTGSTRGRLGQLTHWLTRSRFRKLAAAIVTEHSQKEVLSRVMPPEKIHVIPLGVHLKLFSEAYQRFESSEVQIEPFSIITLGNWMRDWKFYSTVLDWCAQHRPLWRFHLVNRKLDSTLKAALAVHHNLSIHEQLSDEQLRHRLYVSKLHFLPVTGASGNNALIEGMAMGCPALMTDVVSKRFPLISPSVRLYAPHHLEQAISIADEILQMPDAGYLQLKADTFALARNYDWSEIARRTLHIYQQALK